MAGRAGLIITAAALLAGGSLGAWWLGAGPDAVALSDPADPGRVALGARVYAAECSACHGAPDAPPDDTRPAPSHGPTGHTWHHGDRMLFAYVHDGGAAVVESLGIAGFESGMPGFGDRLTDAEIGAALAFIKTHWPERLAAYQRKATAAE